MIQRIPLQRVDDKPRLMTTGRPLFTHPKAAMPDEHPIGLSGHRYVVWSRKQSRWVVVVPGRYVGAYATVTDAVRARDAFMAGRDLEQEEDRNAA